MEIVMTMSHATASEIHSRLPNPPGYSAVRALLRVMEQKGVLTHDQDGPRYVFRPSVPLEKARRSFLRRTLDTLFQGSREQLVSALLDSGDKIDAEEYDRLIALIEKARRQE